MQRIAMPRKQQGVLRRIYAHTATGSPVVRNKTTEQ